MTTSNKQQAIGNEQKSRGQGAGSRESKSNNQQAIGNQQ